MFVENQTPVTWPLRLAFAFYAVVATALYAASFALSRSASELLPVASAVGLAAAVSWPIFGAALLVWMRGRPSPLDWADACLKTMAVGNTVLLLSVAANLFISTFPGIGFWPAGGPGEPAVHGAVLAASNLSMAAVFVGQARVLGMRPAVALAMWFGVLGGTFLLLLAAMKASGFLLS